MPPLTKSTIATARAALLAAGILLGASAALSPVSANETYELPAGGLLFVYDERIVVEAHEVSIGRSSMKSTYAVRNHAAEPVSRIVSFPLPEIDMNVLGDELVVLASPDPSNYAAAAVAVDGSKVALGFEQRAWAFARDVTGVLEAAKLPLNPKAGGTDEAMAALAPEKVGELEERGIVRREGDVVRPNWAVRTTAFWRQTFEPGKLHTIGLAYAPVTASGLWQSDRLAELKDTYCIDDKQAKALTERAAKSGRGLVMHRVTYSVANSPGWWVAIPNFRLAIEKPSFEALVATCIKDLRIVGPTLVERIWRDFRPGEDIRVLFVN